jgi:hypothetical protein
VLDFRVGALGDIEACPRDVRFTPNSGHRQSTLRCPLSANSGHYKRRSEIALKRKSDSENQSDQQVAITPDACSDNAGQITKVQKAHIGFGRFEVKLDLFRH